MTNPNDATSLLTDRQIEVLALAARGFTSSDIAAALHSNTTAIETHLRHIRGRLGARNTTHAVHLGHIAGILRAPVATPTRPRKTVRDVITDPRVLDNLLQLIADNDVYFDTDTWTYRSFERQDLDRSRAVYDLETLGRIRLHRGGGIEITDAGYERLADPDRGAATVSAAEHRALITHLYLNERRQPTEIAAQIGCLPTAVRSCVKRWRLTEQRNQANAREGRQAQQERSAA